jgi:phosphatidylinositol 3-kinase
MEDALREAVQAGIIPPLDEHQGFWVESFVDPQADPSDPLAEVYYYHTTTGASQFERPEGVRIVRELDLPPDLRPVEDEEPVCDPPASGEKSKGSDAAADAPAADGLIRSGDIVIDPERLNEWSKMRDDDGDEYYYNATLGVSIWEDPWDLVRAAKGPSHSDEDLKRQNEDLKRQNEEFIERIASLETELASTRLELTLAKEGEEQAVARASAAENEVARLKQAPAPIKLAALDSDTTASILTAPTPSQVPQRPAVEPEDPLAGASSAARVAAALLSSKSDRSMITGANTRRGSGGDDAAWKRRHSASASLRQSEDDDDGSSVSLGEAHEGEVRGTFLGKAPERTLSFLKSVPLFHSFTESQFSAMTSKLSLLQFRDKEVIIRQGNPGDRFFVIVEGKVAVRKLTDGDLKKRSGGGVSFSKSVRSLPRAMSDVASATTEEELGTSPASSNGLGRSASMRVGLSGPERGDSFGSDSELGGMMDLEGDYDAFEDDVDSLEQQMTLAFGPVVAELSKGFFFGERALINHDVRAATCVAASEVQVLCLDRKAFRECVSGIEDIIGNYARRHYSVEDPELRGLQAHVAAFANALVEARGAAFESLIAAGRIDMAALEHSDPTDSKSGKSRRSSQLETVHETSEGGSSDAAALVTARIEQAISIATTRQAASAMVEDEVCGATADGEPSPLSVLGGGGGGEGRSRSTAEQLGASPVARSVLESMAVQFPEVGVLSLLALAAQRLRLSTGSDAAFAVFVDSDGFIHSSLNLPHGAESTGPAIVLRHPKGLEKEEDTGTAGSYGGSVAPSGERHPGPMTGAHASCIGMVRLTSDPSIVGALGEALHLRGVVSADSTSDPNDWLAPASPTVVAIEALAASAVARDVTPGWARANFPPRFASRSSSVDDSAPTIPKVRDFVVTPVMASDGRPLALLCVVNSTTSAGAVKPLSKNVSRIALGVSQTLASAIELRALELGVLLGREACLPQHTMAEKLSVRVMAARSLPAPKGATFSKSGALKKVPTSASVNVIMTVYHAGVALSTSSTDGAPLVMAPSSVTKLGDATPMSVTTPMTEASGAGDADDDSNDTSAPQAQLSTAWRQKLQGSLSISDAPMGARVIFEVLYKDGTPCGWAGATLFDHLGAVRQGNLTLMLWPGSTSADQVLTATCLDNRYAPEGAATELIVQFPVSSAPILAMPDPPLPSVAGGVVALAGGEPVLDIGSGTPPSSRPSSPRVRTRGGNKPHAAKFSAWTSDSATLEILGTHATAEEYRASTAELRKVAGRDPLYVLTDAEKKLLWNNRRYIVDSPDLLPKFLLSVPWDKGAAVAEAVALARRWRPLSPIQALQLLDNKYPDPRVRSLAVSYLEKLSDTELGSFLLQLTQVLKFEPHLDSALARFLLRRALRRPRLVGHQLYWLLRAEMHVPEVAERFGAILETYLRSAGDHRTDLGHQMFVMTKLESTAMAIKAVTGGKKERAFYLSQDLPKIVFPDRFQLPLGPQYVASGLVVDKCRVMSSKKLPLWLAFTRPTDSEAKDPVFRVLFKAGDDLRQDQLTLQVLRVMDNLWKSEGLDLAMKPYGCVSTGDEIGMLEVVENSETIASIVASRVTSAAKGFGRKLRAAFSAYREDTLQSWLEEQPHNEEHMEEVIDRFMRSVAGSCVATYVLGIGDRHNDNVMMTRDGCFFHIDFGHFLGNFKVKMGYKREKAPFIFTPSMAHVLGGPGAPKYNEFVAVCCKAYNILRRHAELLLTLFALMKSCGIPELRKDSDIFWLRDHLNLGMTDEQASKHFAEQIDVARRTRTTQFNDACHLLKHA